MILVLSDLWLPFPGGAERLMFNLARDLMQRGEDVRVLTSYDAATAFDGPPVFMRDGGIGIRARHDEGWAVIRSVVDEWRPSVIITHHLFAFEFEAELGELGVPVVQVVLNGHRLPFAAVAAYISGYVMHRCGDARAQDLIVYPLAFPDVVAESHARGIGFIKPITHKGVELFYDIAARLPQRPFVVLRGEWQNIEIIRESPNVRFMEPVADVRDFWSEVDRVLVPSLSEDAGTVGQEAALNGVPCISSNVGGLPETNRGGVVLASRRAADWVRAITVLDDPAILPARIIRQREGLRDLDQGGRLDQFADAVKRAQR